MKSAFFLSLVLIFACACVFATHLPRKVKTSRESYRDVDVIYDSVATSRGERLRIIITKPSSVKGKLPVVFVAGWLSCDSVEAPENTRDETGMLFRQLAQLSGFCLLRVDKQGVGDSEGNCAENDFDSELAGYRAAFRALKNYDLGDTDRIYLLGHQQRRRLRANRSGDCCRTGRSARAYRCRRLGENMVRAQDGN